MDKFKDKIMANKMSKRRDRSTNDIYKYKSLKLRGYNY